MRWTERAEESGGVEDRRDDRREFDQHAGSKRDAHLKSADFLETVKCPTISFHSKTKDTWRNVRIGATATTKLNRKDWGLTWNQARRGLADDEVAITLDIEAMKVVPATNTSGN